MQHRMPPFYKCCLCFYGFSDEEKKHMEELTIENGMNVKTELILPVVTYAVSNIHNHNLN